jgi:hypothetical protein
MSENKATIRALELDVPASWTLQNYSRHVCKIRFVKLPSKNQLEIFEEIAGIFPGNITVARDKPHVWSIAFVSEEEATNAS